MTHAPNRGQSAGPPPFSPDLPEDSVFAGHRHGVFYPTGCTVVAFDSESSLRRAWQEGLADLLSPERVVALQAPAMHRLVARSEADATMAARIVESELKQLALFGQIADHGGAFLVIDSSEVDTDRLKALLIRQKVVKANHYGRITISHLVETDPSLIDSNPLGVNERRPEEI